MLNGNERDERHGRARVGHENPTESELEEMEGAGRPSAVLRALNNLETVVAQHTDWLKNWHLEVLSGLSSTRRHQITPPALLLPQWIEDPVLRTHPQHKNAIETLSRLQREAEEICAAIKETGAIPIEEYNQFMNTVLSFASVVRLVQNDTWNQLANVDPLTGLGNRRAMWRKLKIECERQSRNQYPCCVAMLDLDLFKHINDTMGHAVGDAVLRHVASALLASVRPYDAVFRYGGDEFLLCLPNADLRAAWAIIERLRLKIAKSRIAVRKGEEIAITLSVGIASLEQDTGAEAALERADSALYAAKRNGRNRVHAWSGPLSGPGGT